MKFYLTTKKQKQIIEKYKNLVKERDELFAMNYEKEFIYKISKKICGYTVEIDESYLEYTSDKIVEGYRRESKITIDFTKIDEHEKELYKKLKSDSSRVNEIRYEKKKLEKELIKEVERQYVLCGNCEILECEDKRRMINKTTNYIVISGGYLELNTTEV